MEKYQLRTFKGNDFHLATSAMQKAIRRGDARTAGYFALDLYSAGFEDYVWYRLLVISAEDCYGIITQEIEALYNSYKLGKAKKKTPRIFLAKAVIVLAMAKKSRDADHLTNFVYDRDLVDHEAIQQYFDEVKAEPIPDYAYDVHTMEGKRMGRTKQMFFEEEFTALQPRQKGLFDDVINKKNV